MSQTLKKAREDFLKNCELVVKAPASFYWAGEFADIYGYPAIIQAIPLYAYVGITRGLNKRKIQMKSVKPFTNITPKHVSPSEFYYMYVTEPNSRCHERRRSSRESITYFNLQRMSLLNRYIEYWKHTTKQDDFAIRIWSEIPLGCGLNAFAAIATALSCVLCLTEENSEDFPEVLNILEERDGIKNGSFTRNEGFLKIFRKASIIEACLRGALGSGAGIFAAFLRANRKGPLLYRCNGSSLPSMYNFFLTYRYKPLSMWDRAEADAEKIHPCGGSLELEELPQALITHSGGHPFSYAKLIMVCRDWFGFRGEDLNWVRAWLGTPKEERSEERLLKNDAFERYRQAIDQSELPFMQILGSYSLKMLKALQFKRTYFTEVKTVMNETSRFLDFCIRSAPLAWVEENMTQSYKPLLDYLLSRYNTLEIPTGLYRIEDFAIWKLPIAFTPSGYEMNDFVIFGDQNEISEIKKQIIRNNEFWIHFSSMDMGWEADGLTIVKAPEEKVAIAPPEQDTVEIGIREKKPYMLINKKLPYKSLAEAIFAGLTVLLAAREKGRKLNKVENLLSPPVYPRKEYLLSKIRDFLMDYLGRVPHKMEVERGAILPSDGEGNVELGIFEKEGIIIKDSICTFESQHMQRAEREIQQVLRTLKAVDERRPSPWDSPVFEEAFNRFKEQASLTFRHTRMVMTAAQLKGWEFQEGNAKWWQRWQNLISKTCELLKRVRYPKERIAEEFYLPQRGHQ